MFAFFEVVNDFVNEKVIGKIADLIVTVIEKLDIKTRLKKELGDEISNLKARQITLADLNSEEVSSNE